MHQHAKSSTSNSLYVCYKFVQSIYIGNGIVIIIIIACPTYIQFSLEESLY